MASLEIRNINKVFEKHKAVGNIQLNVADGEFVVLLGPSGCGKSTLLRMIAGLEMPTEGDIIIGSRVVTQLPPKDRDISMVFQNYALYPHLSVYENIAFPLRMRGWKGSKLDEKVKWAANMVEIAPLFERKPRQISGGQRQRCALARSLVREPSVFLLDEPLSNLDAKLRQSAREQLRDFQERVGLTSIYVTHDQTEAMALGDRIVIMDSGSIRQIGTPLEIYEQPADTFVATFIGTPPMNLIQGENFITGFRPENFMPESFFDNNTSLVKVPFEPYRAEYLGDEKIYYGATRGPFFSDRVIARVPNTFKGSIPLNEVSTFAVPETGLHYFESGNTGKAVTRRKSGPNVNAGEH